MAWLPQHKLAYTPIATDNYSKKVPFLKTHQTMKIVYSKILNTPIHIFSSSLTIL